jgi:hypothetical protein
MKRAMCVLLAVVAYEDPQKPAKPVDDEDVVVAGLPEGEPPALPERVQWDWAGVLAAKTATRERFDLSGFWRFAAVDEQEATVARGEMGWIDMPEFPSSDGANVFDRRFRESDGLWRGKPLDKFPFLWIERDIRVTNADALEWLNRRIFLVVAGQWADSEIYTSQRIAKQPTNQDNDAARDVHVHVEPVASMERDGSRWCDITEQLIYPGTTHISFRFKRTAATAETAQDAPAAKPYIGLERWPTGPRIDSIRLLRNSDPATLELSFQLERPQGYMIPGRPPVRTLPLSLQVRVETEDSNSVIAKRTEEIGALADLKRTVTLTVPMPTADKMPASARLRLHAQLLITNGGVFDEPFPLQFRFDELEVAQ